MMSAMQSHLLQIHMDKAIENELIHMYISLSTRQVLQVMNYRLTYT